MIQIFGFWCEAMIFLFSFFATAFRVHFADSLWWLFFCKFSHCFGPFKDTLLSGRGNLPLAHFTLLSRVWPGAGEVKGFVRSLSWMILWLTSPTQCWNQLAPISLFCLAARPHCLPNETKVLLKARRKPFNSLDWEKTSFKARGWGRGL